MRLAQNKGTRLVRAHTLDFVLVNGGDGVNVYTSSCKTVGKWHEVHG